MDYKLSHQLFPTLFLVFILSSSPWVVAQACQNEVSIAMLSEISLSCNTANMEFSASALSFNLMAEYVFSLIENGANDTEHLRVDGVSYSLQHHDICSNSSFSTKTASSLLPDSVWRDEQFCTNDPADNTSLLLGFVGPTWSSDAVHVASFASELNFPVVSPSATLVALNDRTLYSSFYRTTPTDLDHSRAIVEMLLSLNMRYVMLVYVDNDYGNDNAAEIIRYGEQKGICLSRNPMNISMDPYQPTDYEELAKSMLNDDARAIVYIGLEEISKTIEFYLQAYAGRSTAVKKFMILSDGTDPSSVKAKLNLYSNPHNALDIVYVHPYSNPVLVGQLRDYIRDRQNDQKTGSTETSGWLDLVSDNLLDNLTFTQSVLEAVLSLLQAFKATHASLCGATAGLCSEILKSNAFYGRLNMNMQLLNSNISFLGQSYHIEFDESGTKVQSYGDIYTISAIRRQDETPQRVARYERYGGNIRLVKEASIAEKIDTSYVSVCDIGNGNDCSMCVRKRDAYFYRKGTSPLVLIGVGTISEKATDFSCGDIRMNHVIRMEAFYYAVEVLKQRINIDFSTIFIDSCSVKLRVNQIFSTLFDNGAAIDVTDTNGDIQKILIRHIVAVIGDQSSDTSIFIQNIIDGFDIAQITSGTSVWLSDRIRYPDILRTVPDDDAQAKIIISLASELKLKHVGLIYTNSVYAQTGIQRVRQYAKQNEICISYDAMMASESDAERVAIAITDNMDIETTAFIYFGEKEQIEMLLDSINGVASRRENWRLQSKFFIGSELWGNDEEIIKGREQVTYGSLTLALDTRTFPLTASRNEKQINLLQEHLRSQRPDGNNQIFIDFWQNHFSCYLPGEQSTQKIECTNSCTLGEQGSCGSAPTLDYNETLAVHTIMAVMSVGYTFIQLGCDNPEQNFCQAQFATSEGRQQFFTELKKITIPKGLDSRVPEISPFEESGNGAPEYLVYNIQKINGDDASYVNVYHSPEGSLENLEQVLWYRSNDHVITDRTFDMCVACVCGFDETTAKAAGTNNDGNCKQISELFPINLVALVLIAILIVLICVVIVILCRRRQAGNYEKFARPSMSDISLATRSTQPLPRPTGGAFGGPSASEPPMAYYCDADEINQLRNPNVGGTPSVPNRHPLLSQQSQQSFAFSNSETIPEEPSSIPRTTAPRVNGSVRSGGSGAQMSLAKLSNSQRHRLRNDYQSDEQDLGAGGGPREQPYIEPFSTNMHSTGNPGSSTSAPNLRGNLSRGSSLAQSADNSAAFMDIAKPSPPITKHQKLNDYDLPRVDPVGQTSVEMESMNSDNPRPLTLNPQS